MMISVMCDPIPSISLYLRYSTVAGFSVPTLFPHFRSTSSAKAEQDTPVTHDSDVIAISDKLRLVSVKDTKPKPESEQRDSDLLKSDEELARLLQAEEEAFLLQQYMSSENPGEFDNRVRSYISQVRM
ncbi:hypothetical protein V8G54_018828, partial [Vigna mungo]